MSDKLLFAKQRDWFRILGELDAAGLPNARVAELLGVAKNAVYGWKMGSDPSHVLGETLLALHAARCGPQARAARPGADKEPGEPQESRTSAPVTAPAVTVTHGAAQGGTSTGPRALARRAGRRGGVH